MSVEQLFTRLHKGGKQQQYLRSAKWCALAFLICGSTSVVLFVAKIWTFALLDLIPAVLDGCLAVVFYALSRRASGE